jgi:hypothetical protein
MQRRWMLAGLILVAVAAIVVPAVAGGRGGSVTQRPLYAKRVEIQARALSHKALRIARKALRRSRTPGPPGPSGQPGTSSTPASFAAADGAQSTADDTQFVPLPGGPSLTVDVPQSAHAPSGTGFVQVAASTRVGDDAGAVSLFEDGNPVADQGDVCQTVVAAPAPTLFASIDGLGGVYATPGSPDFAGGCASGTPAPVYFTSPTGTHTFELRYVYCGCSGTSATFSERRLWVTPLP